MLRLETEPPRRGNARADGEKRPAREIDLYHDEIMDPLDRLEAMIPKQTILRTSAME